MDKNPSKQLNHLGLILDGNRRWAKTRGLSTYSGHKKGYENLKEIVKQAVSLDIKYISAFIFSTENWNREKKEVDYLMSLALKIAKKDIKELSKEGIKVVFLGSRDNLSTDLCKAIDEAEKMTSKNVRATLGLCFNYGGKKEIVEAVKKVKKDAKDITEEDIEQNIYSKDFPTIDLIIRTSGEQRISGFMLWKAAYAELLFIDKYWPDFSKNDLAEAVKKYYARHRRFGK